jgi:hypothetical protein
VMEPIHDSLPRVYQRDRLAREQLLDINRHLHTDSTSADQNDSRSLLNLAGVLAEVRGTI